MCRYNIAVDDALMEEVKPHIGENVAVQSWLEEMLRKTLVSYIEQMASQKDMALEREQVLARVKDLENSSGLSMLGGILGKPHAGFSWDELREEAIFEKYGI